MATKKTPTVNLKEFAQRVIEVARAMPESGKFGSNKAYIFCVWQAGFANEMTLDQFKETLKMAGRDGLVYLSRADLIQVMPQDLVQKSEIQLESGSMTNAVHFVLIV